tara:strand:- start:634 stop:1035 length:402 start_codon:yes stop_codon:yes gene_type:complete
MRTDYNPKIWGPKAWFFIETIILSYPNNPTTHDKAIFKNFFNNLGNILPCDKCRTNYKQHLSVNPLTNKILYNKDSLLNWIIKIHNLSMGKNIIQSSLIKYYKNEYSNKNNTNIYLLISIIFIIILFYYKKNH